MSVAPRVAIKGTFRCNGVLIIDCLASTDYQTARRLDEDLVHLRHGDGTPVSNLVKITNRAHLVAELDRVRAEAVRSGLCPIVHLEGHGTREAGLAISDSGERIAWGELGAVLAEINRATRNNLGVVLAACFGAYALDAIDIEAPSPFAVLLGPQAQVSAGDVDEAMVPFYRKLFADRSLRSALDLLPKGFVQFHAEAFFVKAFARYMRNGCMGRAKERRCEALLTRAVGQGLAPNREQRKAMRRHFKRYLAPDRAEASFYRFGRIFLHGQRVAHFEDVMAVARLMPHG